jgi:hypothetical protein
MLRFYHRNLENVHARLNAYQKQLLTNICQLGKLSPDTLRGYQELSGAGNRTGKFDAKMRELIALAVASRGRATAVLPCTRPRR